MTSRASPLGLELWKRIESAQGYAFISDSVEVMTDEAVLEVARGALEHAKNVIAILEKFLLDYTPILPYLDDVEKYIDARPEIRKRIHGK